MSPSSPTASTGSTGASKAILPASASWSHSAARRRRSASGWAARELRGSRPRRNRTVNRWSAPRHRHSPRDPRHRSITAANSFRSRLLGPGRPQKSATKLVSRSAAFAIPLCRRSGPIQIHRLTRLGLHPVVDQRIAGPGVEGQQRARVLGPVLGRIDPGDVRHPSDVEKRDRAFQPKRLGHGEVEERRQRRALPALPACPRCENPRRRPGSMPDARESPRHPRTAMSTGCSRGNGLPTVCPGEVLRCSGHAARSGRRPVLGIQQGSTTGPRACSRVTSPAASSRRSTILLRPGRPGQWSATRSGSAHRPAAIAVTRGRLLGAQRRRTRTGPKPDTVLAIGLDQRRIDPVQRGPGHQAKAPRRAGPAPHRSSFPSTTPSAITQRSIHRGTDPMTYQPKSEFLQVMHHPRVSPGLHRYGGARPGSHVWRKSRLISGIDATATSLHVGLADARS